MAPRDEVRRLPDRVPARESARDSLEPERPGLDGPVPRDRRRGGAPTRARGAPRRRDRRPAAERHDELPGAAERPLGGRAGAPRLFPLRPPPSRRPGPHRGDPGGTQGRPGEAPPGARRPAPLLESRRRARRRLLQAGLPALPRRNRVQGSRPPVRARARARLAQGQVPPRARIRDRRVHRAQGHPCGSGRPPAGRLRREGPRVRREGRHGLHRGLRGAATRATRPDPHPGFAVPPSTARRGGSPLGQARAGGRGRLHGVDRRRAAAPSVVQGAARGQAGPGDRARAPPGSPRRGVRPARPRHGSRS